MPTIDVPVKGMTCRACEVRITKSLTAVAGVARVKVSSARGTARIQTTTHVPRRHLTRAIQDAGYDVGHDDDPWVNHDLDVWRNAVVTLTVLLALAAAVRASPLAGLTDQIGGLASSGGLLVVVVLGVAAGLSTCMAMVGGLILAVSARHAEQHQAATARQRLRPQLVFNLGRVLGFGILGAMVGVLGAAFTPSGRLVAVLMIAVSVIMGAVGLQLTGLSPRISRRTTFALPARLSAILGLDRDHTGYSDRTTALVGAGTFFLPCGFTQAVQVFAMSTGSPLRAGVIMSLFAVGTLPGLLGIGGVTALIRGTLATHFFRFAGVAVLMFAAVNISGAMNVLAPDLSSVDSSLTGSTASGPLPTQISDNVTLDGVTQVLHTSQGARGYSPASATVYAGREVRWEIDSVAVSCASSLYAPALGLDSVTLRGGVNVLHFTPTEVGTLQYSCAMGMYRGSINVIAPPASP
ncbi:MAG: sulfite exporter TauE/SafE family protein [Cellulomonas sp.]